MPFRDRDAVEVERVDELMKKSRRGDFPDPNELFRSQLIVDDLKGDKIFYSNYNEQKVLASAPFSPRIFAIICPTCTKRANFDNFKKLLEGKILTPIFAWRYSDYPSEVVELAVRHDHMSSSEFHAYRFINIASGHENILCNSCANNQFERMRGIIAQRSNGDKYDLHIDAIRRNIYPYINPDIQMLDLAEAACKSRKLNRLKTLGLLSFSIRDARTSQAFDAPIIFEQSDLENLPGNITEDFAEARISAENMRNIVARGLGIDIPADMPIERYIEIVKDFRPEITSILATTTKNFSTQDTDARMLKEIFKINNEIERIKGSKRYRFLRASMTTLGKNEALIRASLTGAALGLINPVLGCAAAGGVVLSKLLKKKKLFEENAEAARLGRLVVRDTKPYIDAALALYLGADQASVRVLSMQNIIEQTSRTSRRTV